MTDNSHIHDLRFYQKDIKPTFYNQNIEPIKQTPSKTPADNQTTIAAENDFITQMILFHMQNILINAI